VTVWGMDMGMGMGTYLIEGGNLGEQCLLIRCEIQLRDMGYINGR